MIENAKALHADIYMIQFEPHFNAMNSRERLQYLLQTSVQYLPVEVSQAFAARWAQMIFTVWLPRSGYRIPLDHFAKLKTPGPLAAGNAVPKAWQRGTGRDDFFRAVYIHTVALLHPSDGKKLLEMLEKGEYGELGSMRIPVFTMKNIKIYFETLFFFTAPGAAVPIRGQSMLIGSAIDYLEDVGQLVPVLR